MEGQDTHIIGEGTGSVWAGLLGIFRQDSSYLLLLFGLRSMGKSHQVKMKGNVMFDKGRCEKAGWSQK